MFFAYVYKYSHMSSGGYTTIPPQNVPSQLLRQLLHWLLICRWDGPTCTPWPQSWFVHPGDPVKSSLSISINFDQCTIFGTL